MASLIHTTPSIGGVLKKLIEAYPTLTATQLRDVLKSSIDRQGKESGEFWSAEVLNEAKAMQLARELVERG